MSVNDEIYTGTVGLVIQMVCLSAGEVQDPSSSTYREIVIVPPGGTPRITRTTDDVTVGVVADESDEYAGRPCLQYVTREGELARGGWYIAQGYYRDAAGSWPAKPFRFQVIHSTRDEA